MKRIAVSIAAATAVAAATAAPAAAAPRADRDMDRGSHARGAEVHQVDLQPLNDSGVHGKATLILRGDQLRVIVRAKGLTPDMVHAQHIHGLTGDTNATCPTEQAQDDQPGLPQEATNPDELISLEEGLPFYGPVLQPLTPFPMANEAGVVTYTETFTVAGDLLDLFDEAVVLHGRFLGDQYAASLPVACGEIE